ncbi:MAG: M23 family metallopeptidase [Angelakisella sp.]
MKREELWELLGEAPAEMIEESAVPLPKGTPRILRRVLPLAAAALLLCATAVAAVRYFGWQDVLNAKPEEITEHTEPLQVKVDAGDITFRVTEVLADERVLYLLWEMQAPEAIFDEHSTVEGRLDFGEASVDTGGGYIFSVEPPKEKSRLLCGYLTADWNDAMRGSTAHLRVSGLGAEWEEGFMVPRTVESVTLRDDEQVTITCSPITMEITLKDTYEAKGYEWEIETTAGTQTAYEEQRREGGKTVRVLRLSKPVKPQEVTAVRKEGTDYLHPTDDTAYKMNLQSWLDGGVYILPVESGKMSRGVIGASNDDYTLFEAPAGTAAVAMRDGVVESVGETVPGMGRNQILIRHEDGSAILYGHLQNGTLQPGDTVKQGEKIGECSSSGNTWVPGIGAILIDKEKEVADMD